MKVDPKDIPIHFTQDGDSWNFEALWRDQRVGYAWCKLQDGNLLIDDIKVDNAHPIPWTFMNSFLVMIGILPRKQSFRMMGVGMRLMEQIIAKAKIFRVGNIFGYVTQDDINRMPNPLTWYQRHGFLVTAPDGNCIKTAVKKVVMKL